MRVLLPLCCALAAGASADGGAAGAWHGTIGKLEVFARLEESANGSLSGRYLYASKGMDIALEGRLRGADISLVERVGKKQTGRFAGKIEGSAIAGTWSSGSRKLPFRLAPVARKPAQPVLIATRRARVEGGGCKREISYPELFGLPDAQVEEALNLRLRPAETACDRPGEHVAGFAVHLNRDGILSLSLASHGYGEGAASPYSELRSFNVVTRSGRALRWEDVFKAGAEETLRAKLEPMIEAAAASTPGADPAAKEILRQALAPPGADFFLEERGVRFNAWGALPHAFQALAASQQFYLPYADLAPVLVTTGEAAGIWAR